MAPVVVLKKCSPPIGTLSLRDAEKYPGVTRFLLVSFPFRYSGEGFCLK